MARNRSYNYSDVDMLLASKTIMGNFMAHIDELSTIRTNWTTEYADGIITEIDSTIENEMVIDVKKELRDASNKLSLVMGPAKRDISSFKTQVDEDFKNDTPKLKEILKTLGITKNLKAVQKDNQEALIEMLYTFKSNISDSLKQDITVKGMNPVLIDKISSYADTVMNANVSQEELKGTSKDISQEIVVKLNAIYDKVIGICKIAANYYQYEPIKKELFTFSKVIANLHAKSKVKPAE